MSREIDNSLKELAKKDGASMSVTTVHEGREVGTHIDKEGNASAIDRPAKSRAH